MENLYQPNAYPSEIAKSIEAMGTQAISIANRWRLGWPERVSVLVKENAYLNYLESQVAQEKEALANEPNLRFHKYAPDRLMACASRALPITNSN